MVICIAAGIPIMKISIIIDLWKRIPLNDIFTHDSLRQSEITVRSADTPCEITVATATPATPHLNTSTNRRSRTVFVTAATTRYINGRRESPTARIIAEPMLYIISPEIPANHIERYVTASGITSDGISSIFINTGISASPKTVNKAHNTAVIMIEVLTVSFTLS